nr:ATP-dependent DNA helicase PIF1-like [Tanacetum cinerariifolium]
MDENDPANARKRRKELMSNRKRASSKDKRSNPSVSSGAFLTANDGEVSIDVPEELLIDAVDDPVTSIIDFTYLNLLINNPSYLQEKAILAPTNEVVDTINDHLLNKITGEEMVYLSCDSIDKTERGSAIDEVVFTLEFIKGLKFLGVPNHRLVLKVGVR